MLIQLARDQVILLRLFSQRLISSDLDPDAGAVARALCAVQAQDHKAAVLARLCSVCSRTFSSRSKGPA